MRTRAGGGGRRMRGLAVGIVTNISDPESLGRVKVKFPWLDDTIESNWARVIGWYAGNSRGTMFVPEVNDEVMLAFDNGDPNHPYVVGAVWNGKHKVPGPGNTDGKNDHKWFKSRSGHDLEFLDTSGGEKIRLVDCKAKNSLVFDTSADTITTEAKSGSITISACKSIEVTCVDFNVTTSKDRGLTVGASHSVSVGASRSVSVSQGSFNETAGSSYSLTASSASASSSGHSSMAAGAMSMNSGAMKASVKSWLDMTQSAPVVRTVGQQKTETDYFGSLASDSSPSGVLTLTAGPTQMQGDKAVYIKGKTVTVMGGLINVKGSSILIAKDIKGGKAAVASFMGGLLMLNPGGITFPAAKMLDTIMGFDLHGPTLPAPVPPVPLPPLPAVPMPFTGPIILSVQPTVLVNFMPAAGSGALALSVHIPPLPWPWVPMPYGAILKAALMALVQAPFMALLELARGQLSGLAAASSSPMLKNGFVDGFLGTPPGGGGQGGSDITIGRFFPMFGSAQAFLGFLAQAMPLPVANGQTTISSPTVTAADSPMSLAMPMGANSCSNIPVVPNASVLGFSNVMTGMSLSQLLGAMAWNAVTQAAQHGMKKGAEAIEKSAARSIQKSENPALQNMAQKVSDFTGSDHCIAEGHPVDVASGTVFNTHTDFTLLGPTPLKFARRYNSLASEAFRGDTFSFGPGWRHSFEEVLIADASKDGTRSLGLRDAEGRILGFGHPLEDGRESFHPLDRLLMRRIDGRTYAVEGVDRVTRVFRFPGGDAETVTPPGFMPGVGSVARLVEISHPGGKRIVLENDPSNGRLVQLHDAHGRTVRFDRDAKGRITELRLIRSAGRECSIHLASYLYDGDGRLIAHTDRARNVRRYSYDNAGRMVQETDRCGYSFHFKYDNAGRCILTHGDDNAYWVQLAYEPGGGVTTATDAFGGKTTYKYDDKKLVTEIMDAEGGVTRREYTEEGWLAAVTSPAGRCTETEFDTRGRVTSRTDGRGNKETWAYDHGGWPSVFTDPCGKSHVSTFDDAGRLLTETTPGGSTTRYEYDAQGHLSRVVGSDGAAWGIAHRADGLLASEHLPDGRSRALAYDAFGGLLRVVESPAGSGADQETKYQRDAEGRVTGIDRPEDRVERFELDAEGRVVKERVGQRVSTLRYNGMGRIVEHVDPNGRATRLSYDVHQFPLTLDAPGDRRWAWTRDGLGRVTQMSKPDGARVGYTYDPDGRLLQMRAADGRVVQRTWDEAGNLTSIVWPDKKASRFTYDNANRMVEAESDGDRPVRRQYDADGRVVMEQQGEEWLRFAYDANGRRSRRSTSWGDETRTTWTATGNLSRLDDILGGEHRFFSDAFGRRHAWHGPSKLQSETQYDSAHRIVESHLRDALGQTLFQRVLTWDVDDAVTTVREVDGRGARRQTVRYDRDPGGRLIGEARDQEGPRKFTYDDADNLLTTPEGDAYSYDAAGRIQSDGAGHAYRHDVNGRLVVVNGPRGKRTLWYDARDRLQRVQTEDDRLVVYEYDAMGRRVRTVAEQDGRVDEEILYWDGDQLARRVTRALTVTESKRDEHYVWDLERGAPLARFVTDAQGKRRQTYVIDHRGAAVGLTDDSGQTVWQASYDTYGRCKESGAEAGEQPFRLMGQLHDPATGYAHHRFRVFDPSTRRFLTLDPIGLMGGLNPYAYPADPVTFADPLGLAGCSGGSTGGVEEPTTTHVTYTKTGPNGEVYSGRSSGPSTMTPEQIVARRDAGHHMNDQGFGPAVLDQSSTDRSAIRGREQQLIDANGGARSTGGTSGNAINGISPQNPRGPGYMAAADREFGHT